MTDLGPTLSSLATVSYWMLSRRGAAAQSLDMARARSTQHTDFRACNQNTKCPHLSPPWPPKTPGKGLLCWDVGSQAPLTVQMVVTMILWPEISGRWDSSSSVGRLPGVIWQRRGCSVCGVKNSKDLSLIFCAATCSNEAHKPRSPCLTRSGQVS